MNSQGPKHAIDPTHSIFHKWNCLRLAHRWHVLPQWPCCNSSLAGPTHSIQFRSIKTSKLQQYRNWSVGHSWTNHMCCRILKYCHSGPISQVFAPPRLHMFTPVSSYLALSCPFPATSLKTMIGWLKMWKNWKEKNENALGKMWKMHFKSVKKCEQIWNKLNNRKLHL